MPAINRATVVCYPKHRQNKLTSTAPHLHLPERYLLLFSYQAIYHAVWPWDIRCPIFFLVLFLFFFQRHTPLRSPSGMRARRGLTGEGGRGRPATPVEDAGSRSGGGKREREKASEAGLERGPRWNSATLQTVTAALISPTGAIRSERRRMSATGSEEGGDR